MNTAIPTIRKRVWRKLHPLLLAGFLAILLLRRLEAEDRADFKFYYYEEDGNRVTSWGPSALFEVDLAENFTFQLQGVYDVISGATPTGAPLTTAGAINPSTGFVTMSGASQLESSGAAAGGEGLAPGTQFLPTQEFDDERFALQSSLTYRFGDYLLTGQYSHSTEGDYLSNAVGLTLAREFNQKTTTVQAGFAATFDEIEIVSARRWDEKEIYEVLLGVTHVIDKNTLLTANVTYSHATGYLSDQYKVAEVNGTLMPDNRPTDRDAGNLYLALNRFCEKFNGAAELSYRLSDDSFGITAHTGYFAWHQKLGSQVVLSPFLRLYRQTQADFYGVRFQGAPAVYSADYRLSELDAFTLGAKLRWQATDRFALDLAYERYEQDGRDGVTSQLVYPRSNMITLGCRYTW